MKAFFLPIVLLCLVGCTHSVTIMSVRSTYKRDSILLSVVTNEDLRKYENSKWAHFIVVSYDVGKKDMDNPRLPFTAKNIFLGTKIENTTKYESEWEIPLQGTRSDINGTDSYDIKKNNVKYLTIRVFGATMGGNNVESQPFIVNLKDSTNPRGQ